MISHSPSNFLNLALATFQSQISFCLGLLMTGAAHLLQNMHAITYGTYIVLSIPVFISSLL